MIGELSAIVSVLAFAFGGVAIAKALRSTRGDGGAMLSVVVTAALSAVLWLATSGYSEPWTGRPETLVGLAWFALSGILATALARNLYFLSVRDLGAIRSSAIKRAIPFFAVLFGVVFLDEILTSSKLTGLGLIAVSVAAIMAIDLAGSKAARRHPLDNTVASMGHVSGIASALCYASAYVARKLGLILVPDGALGTFVGALAALSYYAGAALVSRRARRSILGTLAASNIWSIAAALSLSIGQLGNFYALQFANISTVGAIQSLEVFFAMLISTVVLKTERFPGPGTLAAAIAATAGVLLVIT